MGLIELFNQWIVERGSAVVQEKHIALFRDQLAAVDKKTTLLESEVSMLKGKLKKSESDLQTLQEENEILRSKRQEYDQSSLEPTRSTLLDDNKIKIFQCLWNNPRGLTEDQISNMLLFGIQIVKYHLEALETQKMIDAPWRLPRPWKLLQGGREYLIKNKLIS
jgi:hypothetical protein